MFKGLIEWIKKVVRNIMPDENIEKKLGVQIDISDEMVDNIELWVRMYEEKAPWLKPDETESFGLPTSIASEIARLVTIEMISEIIGPEGIETDRSIYIDKQYQRVVDGLRVQTEYAVAKGGVIFKPFVDNGKIAVEYVQADMFYPVKFDATGKLIGVIFPEIIERDERVYTRLEYHYMMDDNIYYISNTAYMKKGEDLNGELGKEIPLEMVPEWEDLEPEINIPNLEEPLFAYFKMPLANNKDSSSHLGVSIYSKSVSLIKEADKQFSRILWEYAGTELAVDIGLDMVNPNVTLPAGKERLFRKLDSEDKLYEVFSPQIRDTSLFNGLNKILQRIEFNCGLAYGTLSDIQMVERTATEVNSAKQRSYSTVVDIQKSLRIALEHLIESMDFMTTFYSLAPAGEVEASFTFDDSIVVDAKEEQAIMMAEVASGLIRPEFYLMARYGKTEEEALNMLPNMDKGIEESEFDNLE